MSGRRIGKQTTSVWVDERLSVKAIKIIHDLAGCNPGLEADIGRLLGDFRLEVAFRDSEPSRAESLGHLKKTIRSIDTLLGNLDVIPSKVSAQVAARYITDGGNYSQPLKEQLQANRHAMMAVMVDLARRPAKVGNTSDWLEHGLLSKVEQLLSPSLPHCGEEERAAKASAVLRASGVKKMPVSGRVARSNIRQYRKATESKLTPAG